MPYEILIRIRTDQNFLNEASFTAQQTLDKLRGVNDYIQPWMFKEVEVIKIEKIEDKNKNANDGINKQ